MQIAVNSWGRKIHMLINFLKGGKCFPHLLLLPSRPCAQSSNILARIQSLARSQIGQMAIWHVAWHLFILKNSRKLCKVKESVTKTIKYGSHPARINMENVKSGFWSKIIFKPLVYMMIKALCMISIIVSLFH